MLMGLCNIDFPCRLERKEPGRCVPSVPSLEEAKGLVCELSMESPGKPPSMASRPLGDG